MVCRSEQSGSQSGAVESSLRGCKMPQEVNHVTEQVCEREQFLKGFKFVAKYIGTMEVPRPISRLEIVSAMRRIRYDFKTRSVKKRYVEMNISLTGVHVYLQMKNKLKKSMTESCQSSPNPILKNPIHRIFYVSHDSKDTKIFSYIAKEEDTNVFKCSVFKALKKCQAGEIVKTIGQAFEVSHLAHQMKRSDTALREAERNLSETDSLLSLPTCGEEKEAQNSHLCRASDHMNWSPLPEQELCTADECNFDDHHHHQQQAVSEASTSQSHFRAVMNQKLRIKCQELAFLKSQNKLLQRQLEVEMQARKQAETSTQTLISQNQELLCQVDALLKKLSKYEKSILLQSKNHDVNCSEKHVQNEIKNSPDSGLNETSAEGSQHEGIGNQDEGWSGIDNEAATSTPVKLPDNQNNPLASPKELKSCCSDQPSWRHKSRMTQLFNMKSKPLSLNLNLSARKHRTGSCNGGTNRRQDTGSSAKKSCTQDKDQLITDFPFQPLHTTNNGFSNTSNGIHLKAPNQSKSSKKFKLENMMTMRKGLGDSTTEQIGRAHV